MKEHYSEDARKANRQSRSKAASSGAQNKKRGPSAENRTGSSGKGPEHDPSC